MPQWSKRQVRTGYESDASDNGLVELVVLAYIVAERPEGVTIPMLSLRFNAEFDQGISGSAVERAVRDLVCAGRLRMHGGKVVPDQPGWAVGE
jgi:hypothetical protein